MVTLYTILFIVLVSALLVAAAVRPERPRYSQAELARRAERPEGAEYKKELQRLALLDDMEVLLRIITTLLLVVVIMVPVALLGWVLGPIAAVVVALCYPAMARLNFIRTPARRLYARYEPALLRFVATLQPVFRVLRGTPFYKALPAARVDSKEELAELLAHSTDVLSVQQRAFITAALQFDTKTVGSIMTPRTMLDVVKKSEFLGPLVLDELHTLGHSRLPVVDEDIDHVVGILHLRDLLSLDIKHSVTAEAAMEPKMFYIHQDDTLEHALGAFLRVRHHLFIVINENRETVGLLTLEDVIEALLGRQIVDEDDIHANLRAVAKSRGKANNDAPGHVDL